MINYLPPEDEQFSDYIKRLFPTETRNIYDITFQVTEDCCMACTYCYQHHKTSNTMTFETAQKFIDNLLNNKFELININNTCGIVIDFIGGEPLMEIDLIEQICHYTIQQMIKLNHPWLYYLKFSICSNGLLYNIPKVQEFFKKYNKWISFTISIDGNKELHDSCRLDLNGNETYDKVLSSANMYYKQYQNIKNTKMTFSPTNIYYVKSALIDLIDKNYIQIACNCIFEKGWQKSHATIYYNELKQVADYLIYNNLYDKINITIFNELDYTSLDPSNNDNWCGGVDMKCLAINYKGEFYPCIRYMESSLNKKQKPIKIGSVYTGYLSTNEEKDNLKLISNITRRSQSTDECFYCPIAAGCAWCSGYNYEEFGTPNKRATYICYMHQAESLANVYYWNKLYQHLNINKKFIMHIPKEWALNIINEEEYNYLLHLSQR